MMTRFLGQNSRNKSIGVYHLHRIELFLCVLSLEVFCQEISMLFTQSDNQKPLTPFLSSKITKNVRSRLPNGPSDSYDFS